MERAQVALCSSYRPRQHGNDSESLDPFVATNDGFARRLRILFGLLGAVVHEQPRAGSALPCSWYFSQARLLQKPARNPATFLSATWASAVATASWPTRASRCA